MVYTFLAVFKSGLAQVNGALFAIDLPEDGVFFMLQGKFNLIC